MAFCARFLGPIPLLAAPQSRRCLLMALNGLLCSSPSRHPMVTRLLRLCAASVRPDQAFRCERRYRLAATWWYRGGSFRPQLKPLLSRCRYAKIYNIQYTKFTVKRNTSQVRAIIRPADLKASTTHAFISVLLPVCPCSCVVDLPRFVHPAIADNLYDPASRAIPVMCACLRCARAVRTARACALRAEHAAR